MNFISLKFYNIIIGLTLVYRPNFDFDETLYIGVFRSPESEYERIFCRTKVVFEIFDFAFPIDLTLVMVFLYKFIKFTRDIDLT